MTDSPMWKPVRHPDGETLEAPYVRLEACGVEVMVWLDVKTGAPVVQVDTDELPSNDDGPIMRLNLNDHTYHDNAGDTDA